MNLHPICTKWARYNIMHLHIFSSCLVKIHLGDILQLATVIFWITNTTWQMGYNHFLLCKRKIQITIVVLS